MYLPCVPPSPFPQALDSPEQAFVKNIISPVMLSLFLTSQFSLLYCNIPTSSSTYCNISHSLKILLLGPQRLFQVLSHFSSLCYEKRLTVVHRSCSPFNFHFIQASAPIAIPLNNPLNFLLLASLMIPHAVQTNGPFSILFSLKLIAPPFSKHCLLLTCANITLIFLPLLQLLLLGFFHGLLLL